MTKRPLILRPAFMIFWVLALTVIKFEMESGGVPPTQDRSIAQIKK